jgi:cytochrome c-type biogenesis protein CcmH
MNAAFVALVALMLAGALLLVLRPLLRRDAADPASRKRAALDRALADGIIDAAEHASKRAALDTTDPRPVSPTPMATVMSLALLIPLGALGIYAWIGSPQALDPAATQPRPSADASHAGGAGGPTQMADAIAGLEKRLQSEPDNFEGWMLLGRAYKATRRFDDARTALERALSLSPSDPDALVEFAEALALSDPSNIIGERSQALLAQALSVRPQHQRGLWLLGIAHVQAERYADAVRQWETLLPLLEPGSEVRNQVQAQIGEARIRADQPAATAAGPVLTIEVDIAPELAAQLSPTDVLYVFARAAEGPRMPLALQRLPGAKFPLTVRLDDSMGMMPSLKLSSATQVVVGARVSKTGVANPQPGDLETLSSPLAPATQSAPLKLVIDSVVK